jgi:transcriptional regulator
MVDQVPTWNYVAVHLRGRLEPLPPEMLRPMVDVLSDRFEQRLLPKKVWRSSKMADGVMERLLRMIVPFRLMIESVDGTWKLNQNKPEQARMGVVTALRALPKDSPEAKIAALMQAEAVLQ